MMSTPRASWRATTFSGVRKWLEPSRWERKVTPSSLTFRKGARLKIWKPPESVRMGPSQCMKRCRPPNWAMASTPGLQIKVVHVAQDDAGAQGPQFFRGEGLHRAIGAHRHEDRGLHHAPGGVHLPQAGPGRARGLF